MSTSIIRNNSEEPSEGHLPSPEEKRSPSGSTTFRHELKGGGILNTGSIPEAPIPNHFDKSLPPPDSEEVRLQVLRRYPISECQTDFFDGIVHLAAQSCQSPIALVTLVEDTWLVHLAKCSSLSFPTIREGSFCSWTIRDTQMLVIHDALADERFNEHPIVKGNQGIRFYAGVPLVTPEGQIIGTLCVMDSKPRHLNQAQMESLFTLAKAIMAQLNFKRTSLELQQAVIDRSLLERQIQINRDLEKVVQSERDRVATLSESEKRYALVLNSNNDGHWDWEMGANKITFCNRWKALLGYADGEITETPDEWFQRIHPEDLEAVESDITSHLLGQTPLFQNEHRLRHYTGDFRWVLSRGLAVWDTHRETYRMAGSIVDITVQKQAEQQLQYNAFHDSLTQLPNRSKFMSRLAKALARVEHQDDYLFAILFMDLDRFKFINDSLGHPVGDQLLVAFARRLESSIRPGDLVARWGGDEFAILLDHIKGVDDAIQAAQRIQDELSAPFKLDNHEVFVTASIGITHSLLPYESEDEFVRNADTAMYRAKAQGRGGIELFDIGMHEHVSERLNLELALRRALAHNEFEVHYQPIISLENWRITGFEALVRWNHPETGYIAPLKFIPIAEETGLIIPIGQWVLQEACQQIRQWQEQFPSEVPLSISVNISGVQFCDPELINKTKEIFLQTGLAAGSLKIEITESAIIENIEAATAILNQLKAQGIKICLDDFGTGYSSLSYLHRFPIDTLKIDRSFITRMNMPKNIEIVSTILTLASNLGLDVIAEGVETREQIFELTGMNCAYVQGYLLSRPMNGELMSKLIEETYQRGIGQQSSKAGR